MTELMKRLFTSCSHSQMFVHHCVHNVCRAIGLVLHSLLKHSLWLIQYQILRGSSMSKMCETIFFNVQWDVESLKAAALRLEPLYINVPGELCLMLKHLYKHIFQMFNEEHFLIIGRQLFYLYVLKIKSVTGISYALMYVKGIILNSLFKRCSCIVQCCYINNCHWQELIEPN